MKSEEVMLLGEILKKIDLIFALLKLINEDKLKEIEGRISDDSALKKILDLAEDAKTYSELVQLASKETGLAEITVKKKIAELRRLGLLLSWREGRNVYYIRSELL